MRLTQQLKQDTAHKEQLLNENTDLVLSNRELTYRVQELEKRVTALENIFYKNGMTREQLEDLLNK